MNAQTWIPVEEIPHDPLPNDKSVGGAQYSASPYSRPQAVRGYLNKDRNAYMLEFKYIGDEPVERIELDSKLAVIRGAQSGRVFGIEMYAELLRERMLEKMATSAMQKLAARPGQSARMSENFAAAQRVVHSSAIRTLTDNLVAVGG